MAWVAGHTEVLCLPKDGPYYSTNQLIVRRLEIELTPTESQV